MNESQSTKHHARLEAFAGKWIGEEQVHSSPCNPVAGSATGFVESRLDLDGFFLITDYAQERDGLIAYRGHGVFGYDVAGEDYTLHWFDSVAGGGTLEPARGGFEGDTLVLSQSGPLGHSRYSYRSLSEGQYTMLLEISIDGESWAPLVEGTYTRQD